MNMFKAFFQMLYEICIVNVEGEITPPDLPKKIIIVGGEYTRYFEI